MNQEILTLIENADDFTKKALISGMMKNITYWGNKSADYYHQCEATLNTLIDAEASDERIETAQERLDKAQAQLNTLRKLYKLLNDELRA